MKYEIISDSISNIPYESLPNSTPLKNNTNIDIQKITEMTGICPDSFSIVVSENHHFIVRFSKCVVKNYGNKGSSIAYRNIEIKITNDN